MTQQEERNARIKKAIADYTARNTVSPEVARAAFIREGIYDAAGRLRREYGGEPEDQASQA
jgi:hypothetical protein